MSTLEKHATPADLDAYISKQAKKQNELDKIEEQRIANMPYDAEFE